jgi:SAM-dependent methyltransferase
MSDPVALSPAARAFDAVAERFDVRFSEWQSVAAQRRTVRAELARAFAPGSRLIEIGGGTGEDAAWLADRGHEVLLTDASPAMVRVAAAKLAGRAQAEAVAAEALGTLAARREAEGSARFDGAWSNFAALNCVADLAPVAQGLARLLRPGAPLLLVVFGTFCPGEMLVELLRGRRRNMLRRLARTPAPATLGGERFTVRYHRVDDIEAAFAPWFVPRGRLGIGVFVPPSAAEPWISRHPRLLAALEEIDRRVSRPLAILGDHILYRFERTPEP